MKENIKKNSESKPTKKIFRFLRIIGRIILGLILFLFLLILFIRSPWGQGIIVDKVVDYVSKKTNTKVVVEKLFITFDGNIQLDGLYLEDTKGDTLVYSKSLEANVALWPMIKRESFSMKGLDWEGVRANITRQDTINSYNFQFLIDAFATTSTTNVATDSAAAPMQIKLGNLNLKDFDIVFDDAVAGIESRFKVGTLKADMKTTDLENMEFEASNLSLSNAKIKFIQKPIPIDPNAEAVPLPNLKVEDLTLSNVYADYQSYEDRIAAELNIDDFFANIKQADLANSVFEFGEINLRNSSIVLHTETETNAVTQKVVEVTQEIKEDIQTFEWPELRLAIGSVDFHNNNFSYFVRDEQAKKGSFNQNAMVLTDLNLQANSINLKNKTAELTIENSTFKEISGFDLKELSLKFHATDNTLKVTDLRTALNNNFLQATIRLDYPKLSSLIETPEKSKIDVVIPSYRVSIKDAFLIQPKLKINPYLNTISKHLVRGNVKANGYLSNVNVAYMNVFWSNTKLSADGSIQNAMDPENIKFDIPNLVLILHEAPLFNL